VKRLTAPDLVTLGYLAAVTAIVLAFRPEGMGIFLAYHGLVLALIAFIVRAHARYGGRFWTFLRHWYVLLLAMAAFREIHYLVPRIHSFADRRYDHILAALDRKFLGDVEGFCVSMANPLLIDVLHLCYCFYFASILIPGAVLYFRGELERTREYSGVILAGLYLSYLGYFAVPAVGPHRMTAPPVELDGWVLGTPLRAAVVALEWEMPDAFPSGHTLLSLLALIMSWRLHRRCFWILLAPASGCIAATVVLRYHYVVDLAGSLALLPAAVWAGLALHRRRRESVIAAATQNR
jgi:hypothetical protein